MVICGREPLGRLDYSSILRSDPETEVLPKISLVEVDWIGIESSISERELGTRLMTELCFEYLSEGLKNYWKSLLEEITALWALL